MSFMNFNKTTAYAILILSFMGKDQTQISSVDDVFSGTQIPYRYLRKLMTNLVKSKLIESIQGKFGGYKIALSVTQISIFDIVAAVEPEYLDSKCFFGLNNCAFGPACVMHDQWQTVRESTIALFKKTYLPELISKEV